ncbi:hypothetical protein MIMGU_mgv1a016157mg [Erythranthe guttata]|uniref:Uncharacterized protein n=1 Tax=Erythranthe guttata TaxID=4155 RepID=A0A022RFI5_ERYGU|nr:hypothetical protein MIMGU_mgv1a016157mg [Erythranthe guttata]
MTSTSPLVVPTHKPLVEENIPNIRIARILRRTPKKVLNNRLVDHLHVLIVEAQPSIMALDYTHLSQKNFSSAIRVSVELKFLRQPLNELFCSISMLKSRNISSLAVTVSHLKHLVSFVRIPCVSESQMMRFD